MIKYTTIKINNANEKADIEFRKEAVRVHKKLVDYLKKNKNNNNFSTASGYKGYVINVKDFLPSSMLNNSYDLYIILGYGSFNPGLGKASVNGRISDIMLLNVLKNEYDLTDIDSRINSGYRKTFIHEFIHYLDNMRRKDKGFHKTNPRESGLKDYYNSPEEFNAYYQETADDVYNFFSRLHKKVSNPNIEKLINEKLSSFKNFYTMFKLHSYPGFIENLNSTYKRKLDKRVYNFYTDLNKKFGSK